MYTALRALVFGEDFTSDPVSNILGYVLRYFSRGTLAINVQLVSQVRPVLNKGLYNNQAPHNWNTTPGKIHTLKLCTGPRRCPGWEPNLTLVCVCACVCST